jgi:acyl-CoA synthetase (AMP-forming)/AMP-acid ligase II
LPGYVLADADRRGDRPALIDGDSGAVLSYGELASRSRRVARSLVAAGLRRGDVVGLISPNQPAFAVALYGVLRAGAAVTPVNPAFTGTELTEQLAAARARMLICSAAVADKVGAVATALGAHPVHVIDDAGRIGELEDGPELAADVPVDPAADLAVLPFSSGTTGRSKGVRLTHANLVAQLAQHRPVYQVGSQDVLCAIPPLFHAYGLSILLNAALRAGATLVTTRRFDFDDYLRLVRRYRITWGHYAPPVVLALAEAPQVADADLSSLRFCISGAAPLDADLARRAGARIGCRIGQGYGMTEAAPGITFAAGSDPTLPAGSVGRLLPNTEARILDPVSLVDVGAGPGELWVRGPQVMAGYLDDDEATARILVEGWLRTGDIVTVDPDGCFRVLDRAKELIKYKGYHVAPAELEALLRTHPAVRDAAVVGVPHRIGGEAPKAFVVPVSATAAPDAEALMAWVRERVAPYKQIREVCFIDRIPTSATGKVLRRRLT